MQSYAECMSKYCKYGIIYAWIVMKKYICHEKVNCIHSHHDNVMLFYMYDNVVTT